MTEQKWKKFVTLFPGKCSNCGFDIYKNQVVYFKPGTGLKHLLCQTVEEFKKGATVY